MKQRTNRIIKSLYQQAFVVAMVLLALLPTACSNVDDEIAMPTEGTPILLTASAPENGATTRSKTSFSEGDVIWVDATFTGSTSTPSASYKLTLKGGKWLTDNYGEFLWPKDATAGTFKAYHVGNKEVNDESLTIDLNTLTDEEEKDDPLFAQTGEIAVGGAVHLLFAHTLTKLYISGLPEATTHITWEGLSTATMTFTKGTGYSYPTSAEEVEFDAKDKRAVCFLHVTEGGTPDMQITPTLTTDGLTLPQAILDRLKAMKPGRAYKLSFGAGGKNINLIELNKWWEEKPNCIPAIKLTSEQIENFFAALKAGEAYEITQGETDVPILNTSRQLLICLDFQNNTFTSQELGVPLNGDYHTIYNVTLTNHGLFSSITEAGSISHLALENVTIAPTQALSSPIGAFGGLNKGELTDVHLKGVSTFTTGGHAAGIGGMIGKNEGRLNGLSVSGQLTIEHALVDGQDNFVGGMIGENTAALNRCIVSGAVKITTTKTTSKDAHIGGLAGMCREVTGVAAKERAPLYECVSNAQIDASQATAANLHVGGVAGSIWCRAEKCSASGFITGGKGTQATATGGWAGYVNNTDVNQFPDACSATGDVTATATTGNSYTGGLIGQTVISLRNCSSVGRVYRATNADGYTGGLVGMIAADKLIYNSFSMSKIYDSNKAEITIKTTTDFDAKDDARLSGLRPDTKTRNCHYQGLILDTRGGNTVDKATAFYLNNSVNDTNQYLRWSSNTNIYGGAPYIMYQQRPNN